MAVSYLMAEVRALTEVEGRVGLTKAEAPDTRPNRAATAAAVRMLLMIVVEKAVKDL